MDPVATLRELLTAIRDGDRAAADRAAWDLSGWLCRGGCLPSRHELATICSEFVIS